LQYWADAQLSVKQLFFNFLLQTLGDYTPFIRIIDPNRNKNMLSSSDFFDFDGFLEWHRQRSLQNNDTNFEFIEQLVST